jgi:hypothetical protein
MPVRACYIYFFPSLIDLCTPFWRRIPALSTSSLRQVMNARANFPAGIIWWSTWTRPEFSSIQQHPRRDLSPDARNENSMDGSRAGRENCETARGKGFRRKCIRTRMMISAESPRIAADEMELQLGMQAQNSIWMECISCVCVDKILPAEHHARVRRVTKPCSHNYLSAVVHLRIKSYSCTTSFWPGTYQRERRLIQRTAHRYRLGSSSKLDLIYMQDNSSYHSSVILINTTTTHSTLSQPPVACPK